MRKIIVNRSQIMNFRNWIHKNIVPRNFMALHSVSLAAIKGSFQIWTCHNHTNVEWTSMYHLSPSTPLYHKVFHFYMYSNLRALNSTPNGRTKAILLEIGLYQGDPLSVTIFNTVMNIHVHVYMYLDVLKDLQKCEVAICAAVCRQHMPGIRLTSL